VLRDVKSLVRGEVIEREDDPQRFADLVNPEAKYFKIIILASRLTRKSR
jgi:hypothetical protein